jgi:hypothetical protein
MRTLFVNEHGLRINGQWTGSPAPVEHDIMTGSTADGRLSAGLTCADWTSDSASASGRLDIPTEWARIRIRPAAVVVELGAREPELREHRASRRRGSHLLFSLGSVRLWPDRRAVRLEADTTAL